MLLHIFGDTHGPLEINKINPKRFLGRALTDNDAIVICGDFGFPFMPTDCISEDALKESGAEHHCIKYARAYRQNIDWLKTFPCNILFVDGNHDNHEFWAKLPTEFWNGGRVQRLPDAPNVILTHTLPKMLMSAYFGNSFTLKENDPTGVYLDEVYRRTRFRKWFCGHMHEDIDNPLFRLQVLYDDVVSIDTKNPSFESTEQEAGHGEEGKDL